ncbi:retrotransposon protein [Striga asiatica]|uniref:Retrotransposon protein n=1 Tax=Striga asiatica TaxID=4170 RepID=A0A5A7QIZ7_STRAF|nr:retrotransposon protein [Striga asiatica]
MEKKDEERKKNEEEEEKEEKKRRREIPGDPQLSLSRCSNIELALFFRVPVTALTLGIPAGPASLATVNCCQATFRPSSTLGKSAAHLRAPSSTSPAPSLSLYCSRKEENTLSGHTPTHDRALIVADPGGPQLTLLEDLQSESPDHPRTRSLEDILSESPSHHRPQIRSRAARRSAIRLLSLSDRQTQPSHGQNQATLAHVRSLVRDHSIDFVAFLEPMTHNPSFDLYSRHLGFHSGVGNISYKIWFFYSRDFTCRIIRDTDQVLHVELSAAHLPEPIFHTLVYASCARVGRYDLWDTMREIAEIMEGSPWMVSGDFNIFLHPDECIGGQSDRSAEILDFAQAVADCKLIDAGYEGSPFTWERAGVKKRLDRALISEAWTRVFAVTTVTHLPRIKSDHAPLLIRCRFSSTPRRSSFRFQNMWTRHHTFQDTRLIAAQSAYAVAERAYDLDSSPENRTAMRRCHAEYQLRLLMEEDFWNQKAAVRWVAEGECNTKYFQGFVRQKRVKSYIHCIEDNGSSLTQEFEIRESAVTHFQSLFTSDRVLLTPPDAVVFPTIPQSVDPVDLCDLPSREEIREAVFGIDPNSVSRPDGFSSLFFQACWEIVETDVEEAVVDFFSGHRMPKSFTATSIVLIPKRPSPSYWFDYRPISLCNVTNKIVSKILNGRLAPLLPSLVSPNQSGFIKDRSPVITSFWLRR